MKKLKGRGVDFSLINESFDIDREEDLLRLEEEMNGDDALQHSEYKDIKTLVSSLKNK